MGRQSPDAQVTRIANPVTARNATSIADDLSMGPDAVLSSALGSCGRALPGTGCRMSRLNYLTEEEQALDLISQGLKTLERLYAEGHLLHDDQLRMFSGYRDRIISLLPRTRNPVREDVPVSSIEPPTSPQSRPLDLTVREAPEADMLKALVRQCLGRDVIG